MRKALLLLLPVLVFGCASQKPTDPVTVDVNSGAQGKNASAAGGDNKARIAELGKSGPVFLYFVKDSCSKNPQAVPLYSSLLNAYKGKANIVAVMNTDEAGWKAWDQQWNTGLDALPEPQLAMMQQYDVPYSQVVVKVDASGKALDRYEGFGRTELEKLNKELAKAAKMDPAKVDLSMAPSGQAYG